jgi:hypothetical protein
MALAAVFAAGWWSHAWTLRDGRIPERRVHAGFQYELSRHG